jgi:hypothetical protein
LTFTIDGQPYTLGGPTNVRVNGNIGTNVYGLTVSNSAGPIYQGNYVVNLLGSEATYTVGSPFFLTDNLNGLTQGTPPYNNAIPLVVGVNFAPIATKQMFSVCFPSSYTPTPPACK